MADESGSLLSPVDALQLSDPTQAAAVKRAPKNAAAIEKTAEEFEAMFLSQMLSPMWAGVETEGPFGGGSAEETFRSMLITEYGKLISKAGGLGLAANVKAELLRLQEKQNG